jgi:hypothetical protein
MSRAAEILLRIAAVALATIVSVGTSIADDSANAKSSPQWFIDQRRLPADPAKPNQASPDQNDDKARKVEEQEKLDDIAAKLKLQEEELAAREAEARKKFEELKRLSNEADIKRQADEERLTAREADAEKKVEEAKRLADEARAKLQAELEKQAAAKPEPLSPSSEATPLAPPPPAAADTIDGHGPADPDQSASRAAVNIPAIALTCPDALVSTEPLPGGRSNVSIQSPCRRGQQVNLRYGPIVMQQTLDDKGNAEFTADLFLGTDVETNVSFSDGNKQHIQLVAVDLDKVTKVGIVWDAPVNLALHAFEYAAAPGEAGDVWRGAPRDATTVAALITQDGRGHGFMSSVDASKAAGPKAEVFTFEKSNGQSRGAIAMGLDYETRGTEPGGEACGNGRYAQVAIQVIIRDPSGVIRRQNGLISSVPCGKALGPDARYQTGVVPDILIHKPN